MYRRRGDVVIAAVTIKGHIAGTETTLHARHLDAGNTQFVCDCSGLFNTQPIRRFLSAAQVEEKFALSLGGRHFDDAPVAQDVLMHFGLDPMHSKGNQTYAHARIETFHRLHQTDIAFLNKVSLG